MSVLSLNGNELSISGGNSITLPLNVNSQPGPSGANGSKGTPGIAGSTGPTGPSGPTDPCVVAGTYFCQNGNSYGATAQLGTLDNQDLQVVTASTNSLKIDALGNIIPNKLATVGGFGQLSFSGTSDSNFVIPTGSFAPGASTFTNSSANILQTESATIIDSSYNIGWAHNSTLNGTGYNLLYSLGSNITGGYGMVGQFVGATVSGSSNLMGQFGSFGGNLTVTDSSNILGGADGGSSITNSSNAIVGLQGNSTINFGLNSLIRINAGSATNVDTSIIQANNGTLLNLSRVTANGSNINLSGVSDSAFIGSDINITNTTRSAITGVSVTASDTTNTNATGFVLGLDNVDWSNINGFSTNITDSSWSNIMANGPIGGIATIQNLSHFTGGFQGSVSINGIYGGAGNIVESDVDSSGALYGGIHLADVNNTNELVGTHGGYCNNDVPLGPFGCDAGYNIRFDIHDSGGLVGNSRWTNIYSSNRDLLNVDTSDPLAVTPSSLTNVDYSMVIGQDLTLSGLNHSLFIGNSATISDVGIGPYDYSFIGSDSVGNINTRINNKGNDSWVNISGGKFGIGTNAPANKLDVTDTSDDTPASFTGTSGTCTVDTNAGSLSCVSDAKLKTNILSISNGLDVINQLQGVTYNWKVNPEGNKVAGFIAQDVAKVLPNLVTTLPDGTLTLNKEGVMPYIVQAVKEQNGNLDKTNQQLSDQGIKLTSLSDDLLALAKRVDENTQQLKDQQNQIDKLTQMVQQQAKDIEQLKNTSPVTP